ATAPSLTSAMAIAAGYLHSAALLSNGTVLVWGDNTFGQTNVPPSVTNIVGIAAGDFHTLALRAHGAIIGWGDDSYKQIDVPALTGILTGIGSGNYHGLAMVAAPGSLRASLESARLVLRWSGIGSLQSAPTPLGPFTDVPGGQGTVYTNLDMS